MQNNKIFDCKIQNYGLSMTIQYHSDTLILFLKLL